MSIKVQITESQYKALVNHIEKTNLTEMDCGGATSTMTVGVSAGDGNGNGYEYAAPFNGNAPIERDFWLAGNKSKTCGKAKSKKERKNTNQK